MTYSIYDFEITKEHDNCVDEVKLDVLFKGLDNMKEVDAFCNYLSDGTYLIMAMDGGKPIRAAGVCFKYEDDTYIDCAEWDFRVIASVGFGVNLM